MRYVLLTKFWNERSNIPGLVKNVARQTKRPSIWLLLDDGSTDESLALFQQLLDEVGLDHLSVSMAPKIHGNLDTVGLTYKRAFLEHKERLRSSRPDFLAMLDADTRIPVDYFENMMGFLEKHCNIGCVCGQSSTNRRTWQPMGSGKVCRWCIVEKIDLGRAWDLDWDNYLNVYSESLGYRNAILEDIIVNTPRSQGYTVSGTARYGRVLCYSGAPLWFFFWKLISRYIAKGDFRRALAFLKGYSTEFFRRDWRCKDPVVREYNSTRGWVRRKLVRQTPLHLYSRSHRSDESFGC